MQPYAIVVGLDSLPGIQTARILARHEVPVIGIARRIHHYCCRTKVCRRILHADTQSAGLVDVLSLLGPTLDQRAVLYPCTDASVLLVSQFRNQLAEWYNIALPGPHVVRLLMDKVCFYEFAHREGFRLPRTVVLRTEDDVERTIEELAFPCILKPGLRTPTWTRHSPSKVYRVQKAQDLRAYYDRCSKWANPLIVQEWVEGSDANLYSCNCYFSADSRPVATFVARKLRQWPPLAGISCLGEECRNDVVLGEAVRLFRQVGFFGLGYLEMKRDERTGEHFIIEANVGRPTVRSAIAEAGGVELLYAMYCDAAGWPRPTRLEQRYRGVKWIHLHYDFRSALTYWRQGDLTFRDWRHSVRGPKAYALFSWRDPAPFLGDVQSTLKRGARRVLARRTAGIRPVT